MELPDYSSQIKRFVEEVGEIIGKPEQYERMPTSDYNFIIKRQFALLLGLYAEYITNELLRISYPNLKSNDFRSEEVKLKVLKRNEIINGDVYNVLDKLRMVRNGYAHKLEINERDLEKWMKETNFYWIKDKDPEAFKHFEEHSNNPYEKFQVVAQVTIMNLFGMLGKIKNDIETLGETK